MFALECIEGWEEVGCFSIGLETNKKDFCIYISNVKDIKYPVLRIDSLCLFAAYKVYLLNHGKKIYLIPYRLQQAWKHYYLHPCLRRLETGNRGPMQRYDKFGHC